MNAPDGEEESEELTLFRQQWRQELGIAQHTPGTGRGGQYLAADSLAKVGYGPSPYLHRSLIVYFVGNCSCSS